MDNKQDWKVFQSHRLNNKWQIFKIYENLTSVWLPGDNNCVTTDNYRVITNVSQPLCHSPNISTTQLRQWGFRQCLPFSWTTFRGKHCRHPIAVMVVVDTFRLYHCVMTILSRPLHRGVFCQFLFQWICYCHSSKSTVKENGKMHLCAVCQNNSVTTTVW